MACRCYSRLRHRKDGFMEKLTFITDDDESVELYIIDETRINGTNYLLVTETEDDDETECYIMKDISKADEADAIYEFVEEEEELNAVGKVFEELLDEE